MPRYALIIPEQAAATGNRVTAHRFRVGLEMEGAEVCVIPLQGDDPETLARELAFCQPDAVLLLHAWRCGAPWLRIDSPIPAVVLMTGTDLYQDFDHPERGTTVRRCLERVQAILLHDAAAAAFLQDDPVFGGKVHHLPQGILLGDAPWDLRGVLGIAPETTLLLHPAGIRPVKRNLELLYLCDGLMGEGRDAVLVFCGPVLDAAYGEMFERAVAERPWAGYAGVIPPDAMPAAISSADLVLNHSSSEGLPQALVEAATLGVPILAHDISGNRAVVVEGENGYLYADDMEFLKRASRLVDRPEERFQLRSSGSTKFNPVNERKVLSSVLQSTIHR